MGFVKKAYDGISGKTGAKAAKQAGQLQADSSKYAADIAQQQYEQTRADQMPWLNAGKGALGQLQNYVANDKPYQDGYGDMLKQGIGSLGFSNGNLSGSVSAGGVGSGGSFDDTMRKDIQANYDNGKYTGGLSLDEFEVDPSYQFRKAEGAAGLEGSAAAGGSLLSGAALKSLNRYNSDLASQEYGNAWQRDQSQKQQQFGVDTGLRGQDHGIFADSANRNLQASMHNSSMALQAQIANQNYGLNALGTLMGARGQDYSIFSSEDSRRYNQYANLAGVGQQAANNLGQFGANNAMNQGNFAINGANAQANGIVGAANSRQQGFNNMLNLGAMALGGFGGTAGAAGAAGAAPAALY